MIETGKTRKLTLGFVDALSQAKQLDVRDSLTLKGAHLTQPNRRGTTLSSHGLNAKRLE